MQLADQIIAIYPQVTYNDFANGNIVLQDDGAGSYIKSWKYPGLAQPSIAQISSITEPSLSTAQNAQLEIIGAACQASILAGFTGVLNGKPATITLTATDQSNNNMAVSVTLGVMAESTPWSPNTAYQLNQTVSFNGDYYLCAQAGTSGATAPEFPTAYQVPVVDGSVAWLRYGQIIGTSTGNQWMCAADIKTNAAIGADFINIQRAKYAALCAQINAATTVAAVQAITF